MRTLAVPPDRVASITHLPTGRGGDFPTISREFGLIEPHQPRSLAIQWSNIAPPEFAYLMAFWRTGTLEGTRGFFVSLPIDSVDLIECRAQYIQPLRLLGVSAGGASLGAEIYAMRRAHDYPLSAAADLALLSIAEVV